MNKEIVLFENKDECCGCGACMNKCPKGAISMQEDESGFIYPVINKDICVECGACVAACGYKRQNKYSSVQQKVFAFSSRDKDILIKSASGGAFAEIAKTAFSIGNTVVYGAASNGREDEWKVKHIRVDNVDDVIKLQGSKYVQSEIGTIYSEVKSDLINGKNVIFSGTPCQVDGLRSFLNKEYENLLTVDIICHGVPSYRMYSDFLHRCEKKIGRKIERFIFRDKSKGQGMISRMDIISENGKELSIVKKGELYSYFYLFLKQHIYRKNCYSCPYAKKDRVSDITLGDFWGFSSFYPNAEKDYGLTDKTGVSCILANTEKGYLTIKKVENSSIIMEADFETASAKNGQLKKPSELSPMRDEIITKYAQNGYSSVDKYYQTHFYKDRLKYNISAIIPMGFKRKVRAVLGGLKK